MKTETMLDILNLFDNFYEFYSLREDEDINVIIPVWAGYFRSLVGQVSNGGLKQFFTNNHHTYNNNGNYKIDTNPEALQDFIIYTNIINKKLDIEAFPNFISFLEKIVEIEIDEEEFIEDDCNDCQGNGTVYNEEYDSEDEDSEDEDEVECSNCSGSGKEESYSETYGDLTPSFENKLYELDDVFYNIRFKVLEDIIKYICDNDLHENISTVYPEYKIKKNICNF